MKVTKTRFDGLLIIEQKKFVDERGYFYESFNKHRFEEHGLNLDFVQDNVSKSKKGTIRGMHYQAGNKAQGKLCQVIYGRVLDVAIDIRFGSPTFGEYFALELSDEKPVQFWIPTGFAHGFSVLSDEAIFKYKCTSLYDKESERTILHNDPVLNINWQVENPIISPKDMEGKLLRDIDKEFIFNN